VAGFDFGLESLEFGFFGSLFLLPIHAAPISNGNELLCDRYVVSYAPSIELLKEMREKAKERIGKGLYAVINPSNWTVTHEINFGPDAVGIWNLFGYSGYIYSINVTPGGSSQVGSITKCSQYNETFTNNILGVTVGDGVGIQGHLLYVGFNNGIGSYDLDNDAIADTNIVRDPGVANHIYILGAALDYVNNDFYLNFGNYSNPGKCVETTISGDSLTSFNVGISPNAIAIEFLTPTMIHPGNTRDEVVAISPNPVNGWLKVTFNGQEETRAITISDLTGRTIYSSDLKGNEKSVKVNTSSFPPGVYFLSLNTNNGNIAKKFVKK